MADFSEFSDDYEESLGKSHKYFLRVKSEELSELFRYGFNGRSAGLTCLDLGCGTGEIEEMLKDVNIVGMDLTRGMLEKTRSKDTRGEFLQGSACKLPFKDGAFDIVFSMSMIHHIPDEADRVEVFREVRRVLRGGGLLITFEHNPYNPVTRYMVSTCPMDRGCVLLTPREIKDYYRKNGIECVKTKYIIFFPLALNALRPIESKISFVPFGGQYYIVGKINPE